MTTKPANPNDRDLINQVVNFYRQYLDCSSEQLDLLALWTMHTHIIPGAPFSPALNICSGQKHSGKSLCLQLLGLLCDGAWMHTAAAPSLLLHQLTDGFEPFAGTLLLDDCDATFGKSRMNLKLQGLFTARFQQDARFTVRVKDDGEYTFDDRLVFFPAAFAGNGRLHPSLAERSIQIALEPKKPGSPSQPFRFYAAQNSSRSLNQSLSNWGDANHERFEKIAPYKEDQFPPELSWRNRDCAEPLLHIADFIGGDWPQRARQALVNAYVLAAFEDFYSSKQILSDIRDAFAEKDNPEWLSSTDVLSFLHTMDNRTWDDWTKGKPMHPKALSHLLEPFGVQPRNHRTGPQTVPKGYYRADLEPVWQRHLPETQTKPEAWSAAPGCGEGTNGKGTCGTAALGCDEGTPGLVAAELQDSPLSSPKLTANSQKQVAPPVAAELQNSAPSSPKPTASSQKQVAPPVAAELQNSSLGNPQSAPILSSQPNQPVLNETTSQRQIASTPVAANLQNSSSGNPQSAPILKSQPNQPVLNENSSQKQVAPPVEANLQNSSSGNPQSAPILKSQPNQPVLNETTSQKQMASTPVAANLQNLVHSHQKSDAVLSSQKPAATYSRTLGQIWSGAFRPAPPPNPGVAKVKTGGIGQKIMALARGANQQEPDR